MVHLSSAFTSQDTRCSPKKRAKIRSFNCRQCNQETLQSLWSSLMFFGISDPALQISQTEIRMCRNREIFHLYHSSALAVKRFNAEGELRGNP